MQTTTIDQNLLAHLRKEHGVWLGSADWLQIRKGKLTLEELHDIHHEGETHDG